MMKVRHGRDAKRRVYDELSSLDETMNKFIMQLNGSNKKTEIKVYKIKINIVILIEILKQQCRMVT